MDNTFEYSRLQVLCATTLQYYWINNKAPCKRQVVLGIDNFPLKATFGLTRLLTAATQTNPLSHFGLPFLEWRRSIRSPKTSCPPHLMMYLDHCSTLSVPVISTSAWQPRIGTVKNYKDAEGLIRYSIDRRQWLQWEYKCMGQASEQKMWWVLEWRRHPK